MGVVAMLWIFVYAIMYPPAKDKHGNTDSCENVFSSDMSTNSTMPSNESNR